MTKCAFKKCKNNSSIQHKKDGVTYHRFPKNSIMREKWRKILTKDRNDEYYKPIDSSVICSKHFLESDIYNTNKGFRRLKKCALPQIQLRNDDNCEEGDNNIVEWTVPMELVKTDYTDADIQLDPAKTSAESDLESFIGSSVSVGSALDTPKEAFMRKELRLCRKMIEEKNQTIRNLRKKNKRLRDANENLKSSMLQLKKRNRTA